MVYVSREIFHSLCSYSNVFVLQNPPSIYFPSIYWTIWVQDFFLESPNIFFNKLILKFLKGEHVNMFGHQIIRPNFNKIFSTPVGHYFHIGMVVFIFEKCLPPPVSPAAPHGAESQVQLLLPFVPWLFHNKVALIWQQISKVSPDYCPQITPTI